MRFILRDMQDSTMDKARESRLRRELGRKGMAVNEKLTRMLAGENLTLTEVVFPQDAKPGMKPKERLRLFLDQVIRAQQRLGTPEFGRCVTCGAAFPDAAIDDTPWLEECRECEKAREEALMP